MNKTLFQMYKDTYDEIGSFPKCVQRKLYIAGTATEMHRLLF